MKKAVLSVALAVAGWAAAAQAGEANLIVNADFKTDGLGGLLNW